MKKLLQMLLLLPLFVLGACGGGGGGSKPAGQVIPDRLVEARLMGESSFRDITIAGTDVSHECNEGFVFNYEANKYGLVELCRNTNTDELLGFAEVGSFVDYEAYTSINPIKTSCDNIGVNLTRSVYRKLRLYSINGSNTRFNLRETGFNTTLDIANGPYTLSAYFASTPAISWGCFLADDTFKDNPVIDAELAQIGL